MKEVYVMQIFTLNTLIGYYLIDYKCTPYFSKFQNLIKLSLTLHNYILHNIYNIKNTILILE